MDLSICALLYGGYYDLATRCLGSISISGVSSVQKDIQDIRVGLNEVCPDTRRYVEMWARKVTRSCSFPPLILLEAMSCGLMMIAISSHVKLSLTLGGTRS